jgi:hypothetical protein
MRLRGTVSTRHGRGAVGASCHILIAQLLDFKEAGQGADIRVLQFARVADNRSSGRPCYPVVVRLADTANGGDAGLDEIVLGKICTKTRVSCKLPHLYIYSFE